MIIAWDDQWPAAALTESSQFAVLPVENTQIMPVRLPWRWSGTTAYVDADFGASVALQDFAAVGTNLTATATHRIELSDVSAGANEVLDTGTVPAGVAKGYPEVYYSHASELSARYMRWTFTDASLSFGQVGRIYAGPGWRPTRNFAFGAEISWQDGSSVEESIGGQDLSNAGPKRRLASFSLPWNTPAEMMDNAFELDRVVGITGNVLLRLDPVNHPLKWSLYGRINRVTPLSLQGLRTMPKRYSVLQRL